MPNKKFFISWIVSTIYMYGISFVWHGIVLNDLARITYPKNLFFMLAGAAYLAFGFGLAVAINFIHIKKSRVTRGLIFGVPLGLMVYLIAFVFGISFNARPDLPHVIMDLTWQVIEQGTGGLVAGFAFTFVQIQERINKEVSQ